MRIDPSAIYKNYKKNIDVDKGASAHKGKDIPKEGQIIKGKVIDANQSGVKIKLSDGQVLEAKLSGDVQFSIGDEVSFLVKESTSEQLVLTPELDYVDQMGDKIASILQNAKLPLTQENQDMLKLMISNNMPVDDQSLNDMVRLQKQFPEASLKQLVFMVKHDIPVSMDSLKQLSMLENKEHALMKGIASLAEDISQSKALTQNEEQVLSVISEDKTALTFLKDVSTLLTKLEDGAKLPVTLPGTDAEAALEGQAVKRQLSDGEVVVKAQVMVETSSLLKDQEVSEGARDNQLSHAETNPNTGTNSTIPIKAMMMATDFDQLASDFKAVTGQTLPENVSLNELQAMVKDGVMTSEQLREFVDQIKEESTYHTIAKGLLMSEKELEDVSQLHNYFNRLHEKVNTLIQSESELFSEDSTVAKEASNVKASVEFMNALNQDFNLLHLPMMLGDQLMNSELYIMNDRKSLKKDQETVTALVRLDLLNLGHTDIYVKKTSKNVDVTIYMSDDSQMQVVKDHVYKLHNGLRDKGFNTMGITVAPLRDAFDVTKEFLNEDHKAAEIKRFTFDMRA